MFCNSKDADIYRIMPKTIIHKNGGDHVSFEIVDHPAYVFNSPEIATLGYDNESDLKNFIADQTHPLVKRYDIYKDRGEILLFNIYESIPKGVDDVLVNTSLENKTAQFYYNKASDTYHKGDAALLIVSDIKMSSEEMKTQLKEIIHDPIIRITILDFVYKVQFEEKDFAEDALNIIQKEITKGGLQWIEEVELNMSEYNYLPEFGPGKLPETLQEFEMPEEMERLSHFHQINALDFIKKKPPIEAVKLSVFDSGISTRHPDLKVENNADSFDYIFGILGSHHYKHDNHGTNCAGIIGACPPKGKNRRYWFGTQCQNI